MTLKTILLSVESIDSFFGNWHNLPEAKKLEIIRQLKKAGKLSVNNKIPTVHYQCPMYGHRLSKPCGVNVCEHHVGSEKDFNCLNHVLHHSKKYKLSPAEISEIIGLGVTEINTVTNSAIRKIKKVLLKESLNKSEINRFDYFEGHCVSCEEFIQDALDLARDPLLIIDHGKHGWCSYECKEDKPLWQFSLEHEFKRDLMEIIRTAFQVSRIPIRNHDKYRDKEIDLLLGIDVGTIYSFLEKKSNLIS